MNLTEALFYFLGTIKGALLYLFISMFCLKTHSKISDKEVFVFAVDLSTSSIFYFYLTDRL